MAKRVGGEEGGKNAVERINKLFSEADAAFSESPERSDRYVGMARKIAQRARVGIPSSLKKRFCRHCGCYWMPGKTVRVRLQKQKVVYYCLKCRHYTRHPYVAEKKAKRKGGKMRFFGVMKDSDWKAKEREMRNLRVSVNKRLK